ncbi:hypothetical protein GCM10027422_48060 [Hymenobacter arcticus]
MIQLPDNITPDVATLATLATYQTAVDQGASFTEQAAAAKAGFKARNVKTNAAFNEVKKALALMCSGARRCCYCEDSVGDEVEHIYPKSLYPESCFVWDNYLYACGNCNGPKNDKFAVFRQGNGQFEEVNPPHGQPAQQPPAGTAVLLNPRLEDPMDYLMLDLRDTFEFVIRAAPGTVAYQRARYTLHEVLNLNKREFLREAREESYLDYKARLHMYVTKKAAGAPTAQLDRMRQQLQKKQHPSVWKEAQRYHRLGLLAKTDPDFDKLFSDASEALTW